jgi:hypothetical protein
MCTTAINDFESHEFNIEFQHFILNYLIFITFVYNNVLEVEGGQALNKCNELNAAQFNIIIV